LSRGLLEPDAWERWLDPELDDTGELAAMLRASGGVLVSVATRKSPAMAI
jgi:hypothetical protein